MSSTQAKTKPTSMMEQMLRADEALSIPIFQLSLPWPLECLVFVPGNYMGPPLVQVVAPFWLVWWTLEDPIILDNNHQYSLDQDTARWIALSSSLLLLVAWIGFLRGNTWVLSKILLSNIAFAGSPILGTAISYYLAGPTWPLARGLAYHGMILYNLSCIVVMVLKHGTRRMRPCCTHSQFISRKHLTIIPQILTKTSATTSFPSGDAMGATAWAIPLWYLGYPKTAILLTLSTAFGRVFFLAHHVLDTLVGIAVCLGFHMVFVVAARIGWPAVGEAEWYHPILALVALFVASRFRKSDKR